MKIYYIKKKNKDKDKDKNLIKPNPCTNEKISQKAYTNLKMRRRKKLSRKPIQILITLLLKKILA